ncbi:MAG: hypothetical protein APF77_08390 [Clostridia bacterium BRH_c25]|nr:MAG: hypothetical protein APF77_08390 [Clostridia bacterium BRH_c25]
MKFGYSQKDFKLAEKYVHTVLGMDELFRKNLADSEASFSSEGLVPVILTKIENKPVSGWLEAKEALKGLYEEYKTLENDIRRNYMSEQIASTMLLGEWVFEKNDFEYRYLVQNLLQVDPNPVTENQRKMLHRKLDMLLSNKNYKGSLKDKVEAWRKEHAVEKASLGPVLKELIEAAKEQTVEFGIKEVADISIEPVVVHDVPYNAYIDFLGNQMLINGDLEHTYEDLKHLITHETFPGHTAHMEVRRQRVEAGDIPLDAALVFTNTASSSIFEGIADNGARFLEWDKPLDDQINQLIQAAKSTASYGAAHMLHEEKKGVEAVKQYLRDYAFMNEAAVNSRVRFISHPFRKTFMYAYWRGNEAVYRAYKNVSKEQFPQFISYLYGNMHSANTVNQFNTIF